MVRLDERKTARYLFDRYGVAVVFFGRFVSVLRTYAAFLAGTSRMRLFRLFPSLDGLHLSLSCCASRAAVGIPLRNGYTGGRFSAHLRLSRRPLLGPRPVRR
jgi:hypothetical protein